MTGKNGRRVFTDIPNCTVCRQIADIADYAASQVYKGLSLKNYLARKLSYKMIVSKEMITYNKVFGSRFKEWLNRNDIETPATNISGHRILPKIACAIFPENCHQLAADLFKENLTILDAAGHVITADPQTAERQDSTGSAQSPSHGSENNADETEMSTPTNPEQTAPGTDGNEQMPEYLHQLLTAMKSELQMMREAQNKHISETEKKMAQSQRQLDDFRSEFYRYRADGRKEPPDIPNDADVEDTTINENPNTTSADSETASNSHSTNLLLNTLIKMVDNQARAPQAASSSAVDSVISDTKQQRSRTDKKFEKRKFDGDFMADWPAHLEDFLDLCDDENIPDDDKPKMLKLTLEKEARTFYNSKIRGKNLHWENVVTLFNAEYASTTKRAVFSSDLRSLKFDQFVKDGRPADEALRMLCQRIIKLSAVAKRNDNTDEARAEILRTAVLGETFATMALSRVSDEYSFSELKKALHQSIIDLRDSRKSRNSANVLYYGTCDDSNCDYNDINYHSQSRLRHRHPHTHRQEYNRPHHHNNSHRRQQHESRIRCFNCEKQGCSLAACKQKPDLQRIAKNLSAFRRRHPKYNNRINFNSSSSPNTRAWYSQILLADHIINHQEGSSDSGKDENDGSGDISSSMQNESPNGSAHDSAEDEDF